MFSGCRSEKDVFNKAMRTLKEMGVKINPISLDKYYSTRKILKMLDKETAVYHIPKKKLSRIQNRIRLVEGYRERSLKPPTSL